ncbi:MAG: DUF5309 domain-containing protein [Lachnoclostridium sp.]|nr:DUF5309 domain-containing protein [Lachnoclostridium sp.]
MTDQILTTQLTSTLSPELLEDSVESRIVKIRPAATPLDQITRCIGHRKADSMKVAYYSVDIKPGSDTVSTGSRETTFDPNEDIAIGVNHEALFAPTDTVMLPDVMFHDADGRQHSLGGYVTRVADGKIYIRPNTTPFDGDGMEMVPEIPAGATVVRMGRAASELDVMTGLYNSLPVKDFNYCQIFKAQIESSTLQSLARKEVGWTFYDQEEVAVIDMRLGMEKTFLFGTRGRLELADEGGTEVLLTGGIWQQAGRDFSFEGSVDARSLPALMRKAFTCSGGSRAKVLIAGSGLVEQLSGLDYTRVVQSAGKSVHWGIDFDTIVSKFGTLNVIHSEIFDLCGHENDGIIIDPEYVTKYTHIPFNAQRLNLKQAGVRNTDAIVMTEASCVVLRYPEAHVRVTLD